MDRDPDADPAIFVSDLQDVNNELFFLLTTYFLPVHLYHFSNIKSHITDIKKSQNSKN
jgi:hypothetical protein